MFFHIELPYSRTEGYYPTIHGVPSEGPAGTIRVQFDTSWGYPEGEVLLVEGGAVGSYKLVHGVADLDRYLAESNRRERLKEARKCGG